MIAQDLLTNSIPSLRLSDHGLDALKLMDLFNVSHLSIVDDDEFIGVISEELIYDLNRLDQTFESYHRSSLLTIHCHEDQHIFELMSMSVRMDISIIPVLQMDHGYLGSISRDEIAINFAKLTSTADVGGIIVLKMCDINYSFVEISNIVEENGAKILSSFVSHPYKDSKELDITIKLNITDLSAIIQAFTRYDYEIKGTFNDDSRINSFYDQRFDSFMRYLDI